jgi:hypothetical protein
MDNEEKIPANAVYVRRIKTHYEQFVPERLAEIPEDLRDSFFSDLAREISDLVESYELALRGPDRPDEPFMERIGRFNMAKLQAEERAFAEMLPTPVYDDEEDEDRPLTPMMDDLEIILLHKIDLESDWPETQTAEQARLEQLREEYRAQGRYQE